MNTRERCVFLLQRFGVRHVITKVERCSTCPRMRGMEEAGGEAGQGRAEGRPLLVPHGLL